MIEPTLYARLSGDTTLVSLTPGGIHPSQDTPPDYLVYTITSAPPR